MDGGARIDAAGTSAGATGRPAAGLRSESRLVTFTGLLGACALLLSAGLGYGLARASDERAAVHHRAQLRAVMRGEAGHRFDPAAVSAMAKSAGVEGLKFEIDPADSVRTMQPVVNGEGRILGFLTWNDDRPMTRLMKRLLPLVGALAAGLLGFAGFSARRLRGLDAPAAHVRTQALPLPEPAAAEITDDEQIIRRDLPQALNDGALHLHYQPIVSALGTRIVGVEALLRWTHPQRGAIGPAAFIPVAEKMGLIDRLGAFVLRRALEQARHWPDLYMAVNLSPLQVRDRAIIDLVRDTLAQTGVHPSRLMLEITEGVLIDNPDKMLDRIADLHDLGVRIALDDFGSGYSSLGYLQRFPIDKLKIDRSFVTALGGESNGGVIVQAITALGRALGISVLAEGLETEEQRVLLRLAGCSEMQGYLFGRPGPAFAIDRLLAQRESGAALGASAFGQALTA
ncbi:MAG TPA: EAL domain-containing protein [Pseudolabrys sp.]|nr:EAL domain-containing protein [Pseudolabrys sp.]